MELLLMGNEVLGLSALAAGIRVATGYPGTPSSEILETVTKHRPANVQVQWSVNEKAALEVAAGASFAGARTLVTMKQVGLNVAADPLLSLVYVGVGGGLVLVVADDPGPISSQTEQDTRRFAAFAKLPVLDPASVEEAALAVREAFALSERYHTPVIVRPTTRVCHAYAPVEIAAPTAEEQAAFERTLHFDRSADRVIFPPLAYQNHQLISEHLPRIARGFNTSPLNKVLPAKASSSAIPQLGLVASGVSYAYLVEALRLLSPQLTTLPPVLKIGTSYPFPFTLARDFVAGLDVLLIFEELDYVLEDELLKLPALTGAPLRVHGKLDGSVPVAGELSVEIIAEILARFCGNRIQAPLPLPPLPSLSPLPSPPADSLPSPPTDPLPARPPLLCPGCPHRASFNAVKRALAGRELVFSGDIGCYTLGNAKPFELIDTCLCMGGGLTMAQGLALADPQAKQLAFIGDSTLFASGLTGIVNAVYNQSDVTFVVLDNATTAMTGLQPHPGTGTTLMGAQGFRPDLVALLRALGVAQVELVDPVADPAVARAAVTRAVDFSGVSALVFQAPCIYVKPAASEAAAVAPQTAAPAQTSDADSNDTLASSSESRRS